MGSYLYTHLEDLERRKRDKVGQVDREIGIDLFIYISYIAISIYVPIHLSASLKAGDFGGSRPVTSWSDRSTDFRDAGL